MNFHFSPEEQDILSMLHDFCEKEVGPLAAEIDEQERFPKETLTKLQEMGKYGGVIEASVPAVATYTPMDL